MIKIIEGYPGYKVDMFGNIFGKMKITPMRYGDNGHGYKYVALRCRGRTLNRYVHRLVAEAFIPNPDNKPEVNHIDGNKDNNRWDNLEWVTPKENHKHGRETGLIKINEGKGSNFFVKAGN